MWLTPGVNLSVTGWEALRMGQRISLGSASSGGVLKICQKGFDNNIYVYVNHQKTIPAI